jgi:hypothetical protein
MEKAYGTVACVNILGRTVDPPLAFAAALRPSHIDKYLN